MWPCRTDTTRAMADGCWGPSGLCFWEGPLLGFAPGDMQAGLSGEHFKTKPGFLQPAPRHGLSFGVDFTADHGRCRHGLGGQFSFPLCVPHLTRYTLGVFTCEGVYGNGVDASEEMGTNRNLLLHGAWALTKRSFASHGLRSLQPRNNRVHRSRNTLVQVCFTPSELENDTQASRSGQRLTAARRVITGLLCSEKELARPWNTWNIKHSDDVRSFSGLTLGLQEAGDVKLLLSQMKSFLQVLLVASGRHQREINQLWPERAQDGQEGLSASPAGLKPSYHNGSDRSAAFYRVGSETHMTVENNGPYEAKDDGWTPIYDVWKTIFRHRVRVSSSRSLSDEIQHESLHRSLSSQKLVRPFVTTTASIHPKQQETSSYVTTELPGSMAGRAFANWWALMGPYYTKAFPEMWVGVGIMTYLYYKVSYGGKKAVKDIACLFKFLSWDRDELPALGRSSEVLVWYVNC
ncbi:unnamed protein product [Menidia menidia]|uniref:(Atlantic silverside) hypothetical protein n=1 Tax=Menidia menidia TaxID=238744 RepID=A0A8S4B1Q6_9TELE|nr:unnamed protein product [Menidia menidia]